MNQPLALSIVIVTVSDFSTLRRVVAAYADQTICHALELVIVTPAPDILAPDREALAVFGAWQVVDARPLTSITAARVAGVARCTAPLIAFGEDHSYPAPNWAAAFVDAHRQPWGVVGPVVDNANPATKLSWANLFMEYGPYISPAAAGVCPDLPGHNSSYKRELLLAYGDRLEAFMDAETILHADLRAQGYQLFLNPAARVYHANMTRLAPALETALVYGQLFAAARVQGWSLGRRLLYIAGAALIPWVRLRRTLGHVARSGRQREMLPGLLPPLLLLLLANGLGEFLGYALGKFSSDEAVLRLELTREKYLAPGDRLLERWT